MLLGVVDNKCLFLPLIIHTDVCCSADFTLILVWMMKSFPTFEQVDDVRLNSS